MGDFLRYFFNYYNLPVGFVASIIVILNFRNLEKIEKWIGILVMLCFGFDLWAAVLASNKHHNLWVYNMAGLVEIGFFSFIYFNLILSRKLKAIVITVFALYLILYLINLLLIQGSIVFNTYSYIPYSFAIAVFAYWHMHQIVEQENQSPFRNFFFWFSMATLIDSLPSIPVQATLTWLAIENEKLSKSLYQLPRILYCSWFAFIIVGLLWTRKQKTLSSSL